MTDINVTVVTTTPNLVEILEGVPGLQGPSGLNGATGSIGNTGPTGDTGAVGPIGPTGLNGDLYQTVYAGFINLSTLNNGHTLDLLVSSGLAYSKVQGVLIANSGTAYINGSVRSYSGSTLSVIVTGFTGSGNLQGWDINLSGAVGQVGERGPTGSIGPTGPVGNYVISIRGVSGIVGITNGVGINLTVSGQTLTFFNKGVLSINGETGNVENIARIDDANIFEKTQTISASNAKLIINDTNVEKQFYIDPTSSLIQYGDNGGPSVHNLIFNPGSILPAVTSATLPNFTTVLAGLTGTQTFTGRNTFNALTNFVGGISASGATFIGTLIIKGQTAGGIFYVDALQGFVIEGLAGTPYVQLFKNGGNYIYLSDNDLYLQNTNGVVFIGDGDNQVNGTNINVSENQGTINMYANMAAAWNWDNPSGRINISSDRITLDAVETITLNGLSNFSSGISSAGATFTKNIVAPNIVNSVRGLTGTVGLSAGQNITITTSGNTLVIQASSSSASSGISSLSPSGITGDIIGYRGNSWGIIKPNTVSMPLPNLGTILTTIGGFTSWNVLGDYLFSSGGITLGSGTYLVQNMAFYILPGDEGVFKTDNAPWEMTIKQGVNIKYPNPSESYSYNAGGNTQSWSQFTDSGHRHIGWAIKLSGVTSGGLAGGGFAGGIQPN